LAVVLACALSGCTVVSPDMGQEAVLIDKPWIFGHGGVRAKPVTPGRIYTWVSTQKVYVSVLPQTFPLAIDDMMTSDGVPLDFAATIRLKITDSVKMLRDFGPDWYNQNVQQAFYQAVRDAVKRRGMNEVAINASAASSIDDEVSSVMGKYLQEKGIPAVLIDLTLGRAQPPDAVKSQRIATAEAEQRQNTERQLKLAEDQRREHETSRAQADNAYREAMHLSPEQFLQLESIKAMREVCRDGKCQIITTGALPTFGIERRP
jgi:regulator of protease activity HflC (stomatin/prohibitin superfamily)